MSDKLNRSSDKTNNITIKENNMKHIKTIAFATVLGLSITACGSNSPEDTATEFAQALSNADMTETKDLAAESMDRKITYLNKLCSKPNTSNLATESAKVIKALKNPPAEKKKELDQIISEFEKKNSNLKNELQEEFKKIKNMSYAQQEEMRSKFLEKVTVLIKPMLSESIDVLGIKVQERENVIKVAVSYISQEGNRRYVDKNLLYRISENVISDDSINITPQCVAKYTEFGSIDSINYLETEQESSDRAHVRLELIRENGSSEKVRIPLEKFKDEWKVMDMSIRG